MRLRFPKTSRIRDKAGFDGCFAARRRVHGSFFVLNWNPREAPAPARLGLAIGRKVDPRAVGRNRLKRIARGLFRQHPVRLLGVDIVVSARHTARGAAVDSLCNDLNMLFDQVALALPALTLQGTMRASPGPAQGTPAPLAAPSQAPRPNRTPRRSSTDGRS